VGSIGGGRRKRSGGCWWGGSVRETGRGEGLERVDSSGTAEEQMAGRR
jgi:hypothetical protein